LHPKQKFCLEMRYLVQSDISTQRKHTPFVISILSSPCDLLCLVQLSQQHPGAFGFPSLVYSTSPPEQKEKGMTLKTDHHRPLESSLQAQRILDVSHWLRLASADNYYMPHNSLNLSSYPAKSGLAPHSHQGGWESEQTLLRPLSEPR
jgi:hypothetical protein